jgi:hypothetical protein
MQNIIVLGLVPGTHFQVTFLAWSAVMGTWFAVRLYMKERQALRAFLLAWYVARLIKHRKLVTTRPLA